MTKKLMLDAGHGLYTPGKRTPDNIREYHLNRRVCNYIVEKLEGYDIEIQFCHDPSGNIDISLSERVKRCNGYNPHLFVSIHHNALNGTWGNHTGVEVYYHTYGTAEDKKVANIIVPKIAKSTGLKNRGVKTANFTVLTCRATAILCEGGFMDSNVDYPVITSTTGQRAYANAVAESIIEYLKLTKI